jgi:tetratricopeptide (TPR) repeat protein
MGNCYHQLTNFQREIEIYEKMLELRQITGKRDNLVPLHLRLAHGYFHLEKYEKSLLVALEALRRQPRNKTQKAEVRSYLTSNYYELGRYGEAVFEGEKTLKLATRFPDDSIFYFRMALSYYKLGDKKSFAKYRTLCRRLFREDGWNKYLDKLA